MTMHVHRLASLDHTHHATSSVMWQNQLVSHALNSGFSGLVCRALIRWKETQHKIGNEIKRGKYNKRKQRPSRALKVNLTEKQHKKVRVREENLEVPTGIFGVPRVTLS